MSPKKLSFSMPLALKETNFPFYSILKIINKNG